MSNQYAKGDTVYLKDGTECEFVHQFDNQYLVYLISSRDYNEEPIIDPIVVREIFPEPPVAQKNQEILNLDKTIEQKQLELRRIEHEIKSIQLEHRKYKQVVVKHKALEYIDAFLERRITHVVAIDDLSRLSIHSFEEAMNDTSHYYRGHMKLLTLYGATGGDLQWHIHKYETGGDISTAIHPFFDLQSAIAFAEQTVKEEVENLIHKINVSRLIYLRDSLVKLNEKSNIHIPFPRKAQELIDTSKLTELRKRKEQYLKNLEELDKEILKLSK